MNNVKKALVAALASSALILAGCGSAGAPVDKSDDGKLMKVDVFDQRANYQGMQKGWFAKIIKDKFNIELNIIAPNIAGGGDTLFDTRSAAGNLGDIIITSTGNGRLSKLVKSGLIADMTPYMDGMKWLKRNKASSDALAEIAGKKGIWAFAQQTAAGMDPRKPEAVEPDFSPYIRWDYYKEIGYPKIPNLDAFIDVLKKMQDRARQDTGKNNIYAISLFKDWDSSFMSNVQGMTGWYGYNPQGSAFALADGTNKSTVLDKDGIYQKMLNFVHKAQMAGIVDPESSTQSWDNLGTKVQDGLVLMSIWNYLGKPRQNTKANMAKGVGFMVAPLEGMKAYATGFRPAGDVTIAIALGAKAKNKQRLVKFINWLYSPEGVNDISQYTAGPKGLTWEMKDGQPVITKFGRDVADDSSKVKMPAEWGGGTWQEGSQQLNFVPVAPAAINPETKQAYYPGLWPSELKRTNTLLEDWRAHMENAKNDIDYLVKTDKIIIQPGAPFTAPVENSKLTAQRSQINTAVVANSWKAALSNSDSEFDKHIKDMIEKAQGMGFGEIKKADYDAIDAHTKVCDEVVKEYEKTHK